MQQRPDASRRARGDRVTWVHSRRTCAAVRHEQARCGWSGRRQSARHGCIVTRCRLADDAAPPWCAARPSSARSECSLTYVAVGDDTECVAPCHSGGATSARGARSSCRRNPAPARSARVEVCMHRWWLGTDIEGRCLSACASWIADAHPFAWLPAPLIIAFHHRRAGSPAVPHTVQHSSLNSVYTKKTTNRLCRPRRTFTASTLSPLRAYFSSASPAAYGYVTYVCMPLRVALIRGARSPERGAPEIGKQ